MTLQERRTQFFDFFRGRVDCIVTMQPPSEFAGRVDFDTFKLLLVCAHLEALAKARYAPRDSYGKETVGSGSRFQRLLEKQSGLDHVYSLVALPRTQHLLERWRDEATARAGTSRGDEEIRATADADIANRAAAVLARLVMQQGHDEACDTFAIKHGATLDLPVSHVASALLSNGVDPNHRLINRALRDERYSGIVWREVRCGLVHEARVIRQGFDLGEDREPYYFSEQDLDSKLSSYPLVIPAKFLLRTLRNCVDRFEAFCAQRDVDPYSCFDIP